MIGLVRVGDTLRHARHWPRYSTGGGRGYLADSAVKLEAQIKSEAGAVGQDQREPISLQAQRSFRSGLQILGRSWLCRRRIAATGRGWPAQFSRSARRTPANRPFLLERASPTRPSWSQRAGNPGGRGQRARPCSAARCQTQVVAPALDSLRLSLRSARSRQSVQAQLRIGETARHPAAGSIAWIPTRRRRAPASSSPKTSPSAWTFVSALRQRQAGAVGRQAACVDHLRRGRRCDSTCAPGLVHGEGKPAKSAELDTLCARSASQLGCTLPGGPMCCRAPGAFPSQRQYPGVVGQCVPDRRPQPDQYRDRRRFSGCPSRYELSEPRRRTQHRLGARHRDDAQSGRHHGVSGRSGAQPAAGRLS